MRILFQDNSCSVPSFGCVVADEIGYDADDGTLWFSCGDRCWSLECEKSVADSFIRSAFFSGYLDVSSLVFNFDE